MGYSKKFKLEDDPLNMDKNKRITFNKIDEESILKSFDNDVNAGKFGATVSFLGTVRSYSKNGKVKDMDYEAYLGMAEVKIKKNEVPIWKKEIFLDGTSKWIDGNSIN